MVVTPCQLTCGDLELHLRERLLRDLRASSGFGGRFARYEVWTAAMRHREWIQRCGENVLFNAYRWAHAADPQVRVTSSNRPHASALLPTAPHG